MQPVGGGGGGEICNPVFFCLENAHAHSLAQREGGGMGIFVEDPNFTSSE